MHASLACSRVDQNRRGTRVTNAGMDSGNVVDVVPAGSSLVSSGENRSLAGEHGVMVGTCMQYNMAGGRHRGAAE